MDVAGITLMSDNELLRQYKRAELDLKWLKQMMDSCTKDAEENKNITKYAEAKKNYTDSYYKEKNKVEALKAAVEKRSLVI